MSGHLVNGLEAMVTTICLIAAGRGLDWFIKRHAERSAIKTAEKTTQIAEETADDKRLEGIADRYRNLWMDERTRADQITAERNTMAETLNTKIATLMTEVQALKVQMTEKDSLIARQTAKIEALEQQVKELQRKERATHREHSE